MELGYVALVLFVLVGGFYLYSRMQPKDPENSLQTILGLRANESILYRWMGHYDIDRGENREPLATDLSHTRGASITVALTNQNRLLIGNNDQKQEPIEYERGQVITIEPVGKVQNKVSEKSYGFEHMKIIKIQPRLGKAFRIQIEPSALIELQAFVVSSTS